MNDAHFHLAVNHLPLVFPLAGVIVLLTGFIARSVAIKRTALLLFALGALATIAAMTSGEGAEEIVEELGVSHDYIETHEHSAETFAWISYILGVISLLGLWVSFKKKQFAAAAFILSGVFALVTLFFAQDTATTGGEIRHPEIRAEYPLNASDHEEPETHHED